MTGGRSGLVANQQAKEALSLFQEMTVPANKYLFSTIFKICAELGDDQSIQLGKASFETMPEQHQNNIVVSTAALHVLLKGGDVDTAEQLFARMEENVVTYGVMMSGRSVCFDCLEYAFL